ncbi:MAG: LamG domain-containing protein [Dehalococcoidales bacterium]|nr:LamG domain-containing protein [Dehalococcoidales bacterium]
MLWPEYLITKPSRLLSGSLLNGCVLYVPLWYEKLQGSSFRSLEPYHHSCAVTNAVWGSTGRTFDGTDDVINCGSGATLDALTGNITVDAWIKPGSGGEGTLGRILDKQMIRLHMNGGAIVNLAISVGAVFKGASAACSFGSWHHVVGIFNGTNVLIYVDNVLTTGDATAGPIDAHAAESLYIGDSGSSSRCFDGIIGEVAVWNRALSASEIAQIRQATKWRYM